MSIIDRLRDRFTVIPGRHRPHTLRAGVIGILAIGIVTVSGLYYSVTGNLPVLPAGGHEVRAEFDTAFNLNSDTPVRMKGVRVGRISKIEPRSGGRSALVTMRVKDDVARMLRSDARAASWSRLILGGTNYIELYPGRAAEGLGDSTIPASQSQSQVGLYDVLDALRPDARQGIRGTLKGLNSAFADATAVQAAFTRMEPALKQLGPALDAARGQRKGDLGRVVDGFSHIVEPLARQEQQLAGLVDAASTAFAVTAARRADLGNVIDRAPDALATTRRELAALDATLDRLDPLVADLRPGAPRVAPAIDTLRPALADTRRLLATARPLVQRLDPTVRSLRAASRAGVPFIHDVTPAVRRLKDSSLPFLHSQDPETHKKQYELVGPVVAAVDSLAGLYDANGHVAAFDGGISSRAIHDFLPCSAIPFDPANKQAPIVCQELRDFLTGFLPGPARNPTIAGGGAAIRKSTTALARLARRLDKRQGAGRSK